MIQACQRLLNRARYVLPLFVFIALFGASIGAQDVRLRADINPQCSAQSPDSKFADIFAEGNVAVQGSYSCRGAFIYDISDPDHPVLASWYNPGNNKQFLEAIILNNRGYFGSGNGGGVHVVDLTNPYNPVLLGIVNASNGNAHNSIHEMVVFEQNGATILVTNYNGFSNQILKIINVTNPASAVWIRDLDPTEPDWVHAMVVKGNKMYTSGWGSGSGQFAGRTEIYDVSNITTQAPTLLGYIADLSGNGNAMHSAWPSEDGNYLYSCRETNNGDADVRVYNISNPAVPVLVNSLTMQGLGLNAVSPHNPVVKGNYLYVSWYQAGLQIFDISDPVNPVRVGQYDTYQSEFVEPGPKKRPILTTEPWDMVCGSEAMQNTLPGTWDGNWAVFPGLGEDKVLAGDLATGLWVLDVTGITAPARNQVSDFDGDHRTDISIFRPANGDWHIEFSSTGSDFSKHWGEPGDIFVGGDYDGDSISDLAIFRPSTGWWHVRLSAGSEINVPFGNGTDVPVPADYDADGRMDLAVWRPSTGVWYILQSTLGFRAVRWGISTDKPITGDYEGDGKADIAVWRPSNGVWYVLQSSSSILMARAFGANGDKPLFADFDGNGVSDLAVYRPSEGNWYILDPRTNTFRALNFGVAEDIPVPGDYDGDGNADVAVFRPSTNMWYRLDSSSGTFRAQAFGQEGDRPSPSSVNPR